MSDDKRIMTIKLKDDKFEVQTEFPYHTISSLDTKFDMNTVDMIFEQLERHLEDLNSGNLK